MSLSKLDPNWPQIQLLKGFCSACPTAMRSFTGRAWCVVLKHWVAKKWWISQWKRNNPCLVCASNFDPQEANWGSQSSCFSDTVTQWPGAMVPWCHTLLPIERHQKPPSYLWLWRRSKRDKDRPWRHPLVRWEGALVWTPHLWASTAENSCQIKLSLLTWLSLTKLRDIYTTYSHSHG